MSGHGPCARHHRPSVHSCTRELDDHREGQTPPTVRVGKGGGELRQRAGYQK